MVPVYAAPPEPEPCPFCKREGVRTSKHHLIPKSKGGQITLRICGDCHRSVHACFSHRELEREFHTVEKLLTRETFRNMVAFIAKQDPGGKVRVVRPKDQRYRRKYQ